MSVKGHLFIIRVNVQKRWRARNNVSRNVQKRTTTGAAVQEITRHWCGRRRPPRPQAAEARGGRRGDGVIHGAARPMPRDAHQEPVTYSARCSGTTKTAQQATARIHRGNPSTKPPASRKDRRRYLEPTARWMIFSSSAMKSVARLPEVIDAALRSSCRARCQRGQFSRVDQYRRRGLVSRWTLIPAPTVIIFFDLLVYAPLFQHLSEH
jgi:hypothetical protein